MKLDSYEYIRDISAAAKTIPIGNETSSVHEQYTWRIGNIIIFMLWTYNDPAGTSHFVALSHGHHYQGAVQASNLLDVAKALAIFVEKNSKDIDDHKNNGVNFPARHEEFRISAGLPIWRK
jgi:hypothetical protein